MHLFRKLLGALTSVGDRKLEIRRKKREKSSHLFRKLLGALTSTGDRKLEIRKKKIKKCVHFFQKLLGALTSAGNWMTILSSIETESCAYKIHSGCVGTLWICILYMYIAYLAVCVYLRKY